ncbi:hypothetical protein [Streptomyces sp. NPDC088178]|uniref:hypothetical protein n=1 Tax=Streptomyces sp. NPDC088178 TaxID=3365836 RepID=UPI00380FC625
MGDAFDLGTRSRTEPPDRVETALRVLAYPGGGDGAEGEEPVVRVDRGGNCVAQLLTAGDAAVVRVGGGGLDMVAVVGAGD